MVLYVSGRWWALKSENINAIYKLDKAGGDGIYVVLGRERDKSKSFHIILNRSLDSGGVVLRLYYVYHVIKRYHGMAIVEHKFEIGGSRAFGNNLYFYATDK